MRVLLADPPAYTPPYDHALAAALARAGADRRPRHLPVPLRRRADAGRLPQARALLPRLRPPRRPGAPGAEGPRAPARDGGAGCARPAARRRPAPPVARRARDRRGPPALAGAPRSSPPTTCCRGAPRTARACGAGSSTASTASSCTPRAAADELAAFGVPEERLRVVPHPVFRSDPPRADDGRTVLAAGRDPAVQGPARRGRGGAARPRRAPARRRRPAHPARRAACARAGDRAEWRLGYLAPPQLQAALSRGDRRRLPLPAGARPVGRAARGARRRRAGRRLRRRRARRGRAARTAPVASSRPATSTPSRPRSTSSCTTRTR